MARVWNDASNTKKYVGCTQAPSIVVDIRICFGFQAPECVIRIDRWVGKCIYWPAFLSRLRIGVGTLNFGVDVEFPIPQG